MTASSPTGPTSSGPTGENAPGGTEPAASGGAGRSAPAHLAASGSDSLVSSPDQSRPTSLDVAAIAIECRDLKKIYRSGDDPVAAVDGVSARFGVGEFTAIMGPSGSGKSTLMHLLAGLDTPTSGDVLVEGQSVIGMPDAQLTRLRRDRLGFVFQSFNLIPTLTARENIELPSRLAGRRPASAELDQLAAMLGISARLDHLPHQLSGGQQQRVAVARALIGRPAVVFADEPTGALDLRTGRELLASLQEAARMRQQTVIMVTHDPAAAAFADRVLVLVDGRLNLELRDASYEEIVSTMAGLGA